jgi:hypothetical protein
MNTDNIIPVRDNPQFNVGLIARHVCVACNKRLITEVRDALSSINDFAKDFEDFIDHINLSFADDSSCFTSEDYQISHYDGIFNLSMKQDFAKDVSYCLIGALRNTDRQHQFANALIAFAKKLDIAAEGDFSRLQSTPKMQQAPYQFMMVPTPNSRKLKNNSTITWRKYGQ